MIFFCNFKKTYYLCNPQIGRLAQLVQSTCLTSRGSLVRIQYRPQKSTCSFPCRCFFCPAEAPKTAPQGQKPLNLPRGGPKDCSPGAKTAQFAPRRPQRLPLRGKNGSICPAKAPKTAPHGQKRLNLPRGGPKDCAPGAKTAQFAPRRPQRLHPRGNARPGYVWRRCLRARKFGYRVAETRGAR